MLAKYPSQIKRLEISIQNWLDSWVRADKIDWCKIESSYGAGSWETFYITVDLLTGEQIKIRFSGHNSKYGGCDYYLWNNDYKNIKDLKTKIADILGIRPSTLRR
jgi:hypothetical protein